MWPSLACRNCLPFAARTARIPSGSHVMSTIRTSSARWPRVFARVRPTSCRKSTTRIGCCGLEWWWSISVRRPAAGRRSSESGWLGPDGSLSGRIIALDMLPMDPLPDVEFIQGDFHDEAVERAVGGACWQALPSTSCYRIWRPICRGLRPLTRRAACIWPSLRPTLPPNICNRTVLFSSKLSRAADTVSTSSDLKRVFRSVTVRKPAASRDTLRRDLLAGPSIAVAGFRICLMYPIATELRNCGWNRLTLGG